MNFSTFSRAITKRVNQIELDRILAGNTLDQSCFSAHETEIDLVSQSQFITDFHTINQWAQPQLHPCTLHVMSLSLQLKTLLQPALPLPAIGLVHIANRIQYSTQLTDKKLKFRCFIQSVARHKKGILATMAISVSQDNKQVYVAESDYLYRCKVETGSTPRSTIDEQPVERDLVTTLSFQADIGRRYAKVSGDYNPIHLWPLTARLLGFKRAIAHGMHTLSLSLSHHPWLQQHVAESRELTIENQFYNPAFLPCKLDMYSVNGRSYQQHSYQLSLPNAEPHKRHILSASLTV